MSPFADRMKALRLERGLRQVELAEMVGYEQSYVSALELGIKGPPTDEFVKHLIQALSLSLEEQSTLRETVVASQRKINVPSEAPTEVYWMCHRLRQQIDSLHPAQIELIKTALNLPIAISPSGNNAPSRIRRRDHGVHKREAKM